MHVLYPADYASRHYGYAQLHLLASTRGGSKKTLPRNSLCLWTGNPENQIKMTAQCMGNFGAHKWRYPESMVERYGRSIGSPGPESQPKQDDVNIEGGNDETVWVNKRYIPTDLRSTAPVPRHKLLAPRRLPRVERGWVPLGEASLRQFSRAEEEKQLYVSQPSSRSEDWSTLRQMLPSKGLPLKFSPPNWGTGNAYAPPMIGARQKRFPHINSPMTRYVDDMHTTHKLFKLH